MSETSTSSARTISVEEVIAAYLELADAGRPPDREEWLMLHPEVAAELAAFLADHDRLSQLAEPFRPAIPPLAGNVTPFGDPPTLPWSPLKDSTNNSTGARFGDYELLEEIGRGGMGVVFKARQTSLNRMVALKMILAGQWANQEESRRFIEEAVNAAAAQHPNIIAIHEIGQIAGQTYFTMDYVDGPNLAALLRKNLFTPRNAARLMKTIAEAIHAAHQRGVLHRDLKPSNVLMARSDRNHAVKSETRPDESGHYEPKITDFGLAKRVEGGSDLTGTGQILGTPSYMPPEQAAAKRAEIGPASDVYSLGAVLYELVTGRPPFRAESPLDTLVQVLETEPVSPRLLNRSVPRDLETICLKCLQKQPRGRYSTAAELADDLGRFLNDEPIRARPVGTLGRVWRWGKRRPGWATTISVSLFALLIITAGSLWFSGRLQRELARTEAKQRELQIALARQVAERLDGDLRQLAAVPRTFAVMLSERIDWTEPQLDDALRQMLDSDPRLFGMCVALEPNQFEAGRENFARYVFRGNGGVQFKYLHPPVYRPYREWDWYRVPQSEGRSAWTEPYVDRGGGEVPMVTYSEPVRRDGRFSGVVTADLSLAYFRQLKTWLDELQLSRGDYGFVVSRSGTLISDANPEYQMGRRIDEFAGPQADPAFAELLHLIRSHEAGLVHGADLWTGNSVRYLVAPVASTGWSFVAVIPEQPSFSTRSQFAR